MAFLGLDPIGTKITAYDLSARQQRVETAPNPAHAARCSCSVPLFVPGGMLVTSGQGDQPAHQGGVGGGEGAGREARRLAGRRTARHHCGDGWRCPEGGHLRRRRRSDGNRHAPARPVAAPGRRRDDQARHQDTPGWRLDGNRGAQRAGACSGLTSLPRMASGMPVHRVGVKTMPSTRDDGSLASRLGPTISPACGVNTCARARTTKARLAAGRRVLR